MKTLIRSMVCLAALYASCVAALNFTVRPLTMEEEQMLKDQHYWMPGCPVPLSRLRVVETGYVTLTGAEDQGALVVLDGVAPDTLATFRDLYDRRFAVTKPVIVQTPEMQDPFGYTLGFVCKPITAGTVWSLHSYGAALAVTPLFNPYLGFFHYTPPQGMTAKTLPAISDMGVFDRTMVQEQNRFFLEHVVDVFGRYGWTIWGGRWTDPIDYLNFNIPRWVAAMMIVMTPSDAQIFFQTYKMYSKYMDHFSDSSFAKAYILYSRDFNTVFRRLMAALPGPTPMVDEKMVFVTLLGQLAQGTADNPVPPGENAEGGFDDSHLTSLFPQENGHD